MRCLLGAITDGSVNKDGVIDLGEVLLNNGTSYFVIKQYIMTIKPLVS